MDRLVLRVASCTVITPSHRPNSWHQRLFKATRSVDVLTSFWIPRNHFDDWYEIFKWHPVKKDLLNACQIQQAGVKSNLEFGVKVPASLVMPLCDLDFQTAPGRFGLFLSRK